MAATAKALRMSSGALWIAATLGLGACSLLPQKTEIAPGVTLQTGQFEFALPSGEYRCERGERLQIRRELANAVNNRIELGWNGSQYLLVRDPSDSGLPRFEDSVSGLVWIDLPWKGLLLDGRTQKPLANECRAT